MQRELPLHTSGRHVDDLDVAAGGPDGADRNVLVPVLEGERRTHSEDERRQSEAGQNTGSGNFDPGWVHIFKTGNKKENIKSSFSPSRNKNFNNRQPLLMTLCLDLQHGFFSCLQFFASNSFPRAQKTLIVRQM